MSFYLARYLRCLPRARQTIGKLHVCYQRHGGSKYTISEPISITQHSLLSARFMRNHVCQRDQAIVSALLHDCGHVIEGTPLDPKEGKDDYHEVKGARFLAKHGFPPSVYEPVRRHVLAKRYLATKDPDYKAKLSTGSSLSLDLQGGLMSIKEMKAFEKDPWFDASIMLRLADDNGKMTFRPEGDGILEFFEEMEKVLVEMGTSSAWSPIKNNSSHE